MEQDPNDIGTVKKEDLVNALHKDSPLPQLRTYQGDIAKFIKEKDQSAVTIALKEKEEKEKVQREEKAQLKQSVAVKLPSGALRLILSIFLLVAGVLVGGYAYLSRDINVPVVVESDSLIHADNKAVVEINSLTPMTFKETIFSAKQNVKEDKITEIKISDSANQRPIPLQELLAKLKFNMPPGLSRSLSGEYMVGVFRLKDDSSLFLIFKETDYGIAFRDMLNWEGSLYNNFSSILVSESATSTPVANYTFRDYIVSNKDTRAVLEGNKVKLLYTFLDKNTILITESASSLRGLVDAYSTGNLVR